MVSAPTQGAKVQVQTISCDETEVGAAKGDAKLLNLGKAGS